MNPQQPGEPLPPQNPNPQPPTPVQPVINVPGQAPYVAAPVQPAPPHQQPVVDHSPYDFIVNPGPAAKAPSPLTGGSALRKGLIFGGGLVVLLILFIIISSVLKGSDTSAASLLTVLQEQTELARVAAAGETVATEENTQAFATNVALSMTSAEQKLNTYTTTNHGKINPNLLGLKHSTAVDTELQNAQANSTYDTTLTSVLQNDLASYSQALQAAYKAKPGPNGQKILSQEFNDAELLTQQSKQQQF